MERLAKYESRYHKAMDVSKFQRDFILAEIMTDMEREFKISVLRERANKEVDSDVLRFYRLVADSRSF